MDFNTDSPYWYGLRHNSAQPKASGFYGEIPIPGTKSKATEYSSGVNINGKNVEIPTLVPGLSSVQMNGLLGAISQNAQPPQDVLDVAIAHAKRRMSAGQSPFWRMPEKQQPMPSIPAGLLGN